MTPTNRIKVNEVMVQKNREGYTVFFGPIILTDAPYKRLSSESLYKKKFLEELRYLVKTVEKEDVETLKAWIKDIEELEE